MPKYPFERFHNTLCVAIIQAQPIRYIGVGWKILSVSIVGSRALERTWKQPTGYPQNPFLGDPTRCSMFVFRDLASERKFGDRTVFVY